MFSGRLLPVFLACLLQALACRGQDSLLIQGIRYRTDTIIHTHDVGLGTLHTYYRLPDLPLLVNTLVLDARNPYLRFETCLGKDSLIGLERPSAMALRNSRTGHQAFAAINGDFYNTVSPNQGVPVNGQMLAGEVAKAPHASRPVIAFDGGNNPFIDIMTFRGSVARAGKQIALNGVNEARDADEMILFNRHFGKVTRTNKWGTEAVLSLLSGSWGVNWVLQFKVDKIIAGVGSALIPSGKAVLSGHGKAAAFLNELYAGDTLQMEVQVGLKNDPFLAPLLTEMVGGDRQILKDGIVLDNNWVELHPRTAAGFSGDGSKVILAVVDGRSDYSKGVSTKQLADIMKASGAASALNLDGGGSSVMVVRNQVKNSPSDGSERAVGNALLMVATAIPGTEKTMQLNAEHVTIPFGKKFLVKGSTFDEAGEVIRYLTAENVTYAVHGNIGKIDQSGVFTASGTGGSGFITGTWKGMTDTLTVALKPVRQISFFVKSLVIDDRRDYTFKVFGTDMDGNKYLIDNDIIQFSVLDGSIGSVDANGIFRGLKDGRVAVAIKTADGEHTDTCHVDVEIGRGNLLLDDFSDPGSWSYTTSYIDKVTLSRQVHPDFQVEMMRVDYEFTYSNRTASITLNKNIDVYGMPDSVLMEATGNGRKASFYYFLDHPNGLCVVPAFTGTSLQGYKAAVNTAGIAQEDYPLLFKSIRLIVEKDPSYVAGQKYSGTFWLKGVYAVYPAKDPQNSLSRPVTPPACSVFPNPVKGGFYLQTDGAVTGPVRMRLYTLGGQLVMDEYIEIGPGGVSDYIPVVKIPPGAYLFVVSGDSGSLKGKLIVLP